MRKERNAVNEVWIRNERAAVKATGLLAYANSRTQPQPLHRGGVGGCYGALVVPTSRRATTLLRAYQHWSEHGAIAQQKSCLVSPGLRSCQPDLHRIKKRMQRHIFQQCAASESLLGTVLYPKAPSAISSVTIQTPKLYRCCDL